ncbi:hypothetical protein AWM70_12075 [Paenibacillus yonginensis]|uniref:Sugar ABC transporter permease n=1 Tax=Paenibacillus yonginensis TaxID=1462996 RepID=A0A1B1N1D3_9BACL|nr:hypothetical protein [Paenibacillus yonginensis]ANS75247.1 hypothetical protein AWM70_12075 [Paenibacillus yonginensis]
MEGGFAAAARAALPPSPKRLHHSEELWGWLFVSPMLLGVTVLVLLPIVWMMITSFKVQFPS